MLRPTDNLRSDHALVSTGVLVFERLGAHVRRGEGFPVADCAELLRFLREFVIAVHLRKEQDVLLPAVAMRGDDDAARQVGELMRLHEELTELTHSLVLFWEPLGELSPAEESGFADTVDAVVARVRRMQSLEERHLFPTCDAVVPADDQLDWLAQWQRLENERGGHAVWAPRIARLARDWQL
jgi:hemerythrin-like domain-containing protein